MPASVFATVLLAALLHAGWNALVKRLHEPLVTATLVATAAAVIAAPLVLLLPAPARASWPFITASAALQVLYWALLAAAYRLTDMSRAYPLMRGTAVLLVALISGLALGESLTVVAWFGVALICAGALSMIVVGGRGATQAGIAFALLNAVVIAGYTVIDALGVRRSLTPAAYTLWIFLISGLVMAAWASLHWRARWLGQLRRHAGLALIGGAATLASYGLALSAMTQATAATVAALRETSILFAVAISALILKERVDRRRFAAAGVIALGAIALRVA